MATKPTIPARFKQRVSDNLSVPIERVTDEADIMADLGADSLDVVALGMAVTEEFDITIPDESIDRLFKVGDWIRAIERKLAGPAPADRSYIGTRTDVGCLVIYQDPGGDSGHDLDPRFDLRNHSPTGFEWGYEGSGPAQLALALVADATGDDDLAQRIYQTFKRRVVGQIDRKAPTWQLTAASVRDIVASLGS